MGDHWYEVRGDGADADDIFPDRESAMRRARELSRASKENITVFMVPKDYPDEKVATYHDGKRVN